MSTVKIQATEYPIDKVFSNDFVFTIPLYQRPYAWTVNEAGELLDDLITSLGEDHIKIEDMNPYFLGSIILIKGDKPNSQVVDGQQRLTTLTILLAVLRKLLPHKIANELNTYLYQKGSIVASKTNIYRLTLRERDADFFQEYIQDENGIDKLKDLHISKLSDSCKNLKENTNLFIDRLDKLPESELLRLTQFIITQCFLVVVSTPDIDSAYRIFSVLNNRGMDLSHADILKAEIIGKISSGKQEQEKYSKKWEEIEENLGREQFKSLFSHIRMIYAKAKPRESIIKEFIKKELIKDLQPSPTDYPNPTDRPQEFIDKILRPLAEAFYDINNFTYKSDLFTKEINKLFKWLSDIDNSDWIPPAISYLSKNYNYPELIVRFFSDLDRLASGMMIQRSNINERIERYSKLLNAIEKGEDLYTLDSPLQLKPKEQESIVKILNDDLYLIKKIRRYVLQRLDAELSEGIASYQFSNITVEHVLPQNPSPDSLWVKSFPSQEERDQYVHRLGNLVLLSHPKNSEAGNYDFLLKKEKYFTSKKGISNFALTTQVLMEDTWTAEIIERRQKNLVGKLKEVWRLQN